MTSSLHSDLAWSQMWGVGVASFPVLGHRCLCLGAPPSPALWATAGSHGGRGRKGSSFIHRGLGTGSEVLSPLWSWPTAHPPTPHAPAWVASLGLEPQDPGAGT